MGVRVSRNQDRLNLWLFGKIEKATDKKQFYVAMAFSKDDKMVIEKSHNPRRLLKRKRYV